MSLRLTSKSGKSSAAAAPGGAGTGSLAFLKERKTRNGDKLKEREGFLLWLS
jgi:hypothetical protein